MWNKSYRISYLVPLSLRETFHRHDLYLFFICSQRAVWPYEASTADTQRYVPLDFDCRCPNPQGKQDPPLAEFID